MGMVFQAMCDICFYTFLWLSDRLPGAIVENLSPQYNHM